MVRRSGEVGVLPLVVARGSLQAGASAHAIYCVGGRGGPYCGA